MRQTPTIDRFEIETRRSENNARVEAQKAISRKRNQRVLELYFHSDDRRIRIIGGITGECYTTVSNIIDSYFKGDITYEAINHQIFNSEMNYVNDHQVWKKAM